MMSLTFAQGFEGTITTLSSLRPSITNEIIIKGSQSRQQAIGPNLADMMVYTDLAENTYNMWVKYPDEVEVTRYFLTGSSRLPEPKVVLYTDIVATGHQKTINDYDCKEYSGLADGQSFTAWVASDLKGENLPGHFAAQSLGELAYASLPEVEGIVLEFSSSLPSSNKAFTIKIDVNPHPVDPAMVTSPEPTNYVD